MAKTPFFKDFKAFITKGNVIDMAVGVVIGGSFGKIVTGLVNYIINPFVGIFVKSGDLDSIKTVIGEGVEGKEAVLNEAGEIVTPAVEAVKEVAILWGTWFQTIIDFLITALCIFIVLRIIMAVKNKTEAKRLAEEAAKAEAAKAEADKAAAEAAVVAAAAAEKQAQLDASILKQEQLLSEIKDILKNK
ncbi:MAG: large conductance mechanosensitive channel protein MscL [Clostridia bacterium]|nr:large conductance mechanosensitive channel protein MscL [Clostridia bacterium]